MDRNALLASGDAPLSVALRKESVDRNFDIRYTTSSRPSVALRKESVDRNIGGLKVTAFFTSRSPQGERG